MDVDEQQARLSMQMLDCCEAVTTYDYANGCVLDALKLADGRWARVRVPYWRRVHKQGSNERLERR